MVSAHGLALDAIDRLAVIDRVEAAAARQPGPAARALALRGQAAGAACPRSVRRHGRLPHLLQPVGTEQGLRDVRRGAAPGLVELVLVVRREQDDDRARLEASMTRRGVDPLMPGRLTSIRTRSGSIADRLDGLLAGGDSADARRSRRWPPRRRPSHGGTGPGRRRPDPHLTTADTGHAFMVPVAAQRPQGVIRMIRGGGPNTATPGLLWAYSGAVQPSRFVWAGRLPTRD